MARKAQAKIKAGDKLYRFAFNLGKGTWERSELLVIDSDSVYFKFKHTVNGADVYAYYSTSNVDTKVTSKSSTKYVTLSVDDFGKAKSMVEGQLKKRVETLKSQLYTTQKKLKKLEKMEDIR